MFFLLSKTLGVVLLPTNFLIGIGLAGALLLATRFAAAGRKLLVAAVILLAICAWSPLGKLLLYPLETRFPPWDAANGAPDGILVLGGPIDADLSLAHGGAVVSAAGDRIVAAAVLAHRYPNARLMYSGGSANLVASDDAREADYAAELFEGLGLAKARLLMERRARNTLENATFSKALAAPRAGERWLLVTSAFHMPRSVGLFRKAGFDVEAYPVDWRLGARAELLTLSTVAGDGFTRSDLAVREWMGLIAYWATGKIDDLLPGPAANRKPLSQR
ncbi:MAG: YdcF family protein [Bradyrhizobium sp.]|uniref:YdcF family protein n=1 Tax=Bradyrhizobium sp. TaxID=376 RepID=UPI0027248BE3|nr:YdcF family protein [Bradyrhizobium sp.]MDO8400750.1 YdcF family protein [Bradyrhizobium sp.]